MFSGRFVFVVPNTRWFGKRCWMWFTPGVALLTPVLKQRGVDVEIIEANIDNLTPEEVKERIRSLEPSVAGIPGMSLEYWRQAHRTAQLVKEVAPSIITVLGGALASSLPERVLEDDNVDYVILGEGEERLPELLQRLESPRPDLSRLDGVGYRENGSVRISPPVRWIADLDAFPPPDYKVFDWRKVMTFKQEGAVGGMGVKRTPVGVVMTSRGCPFRCCFCAGYLSMGRSVRFRSPKSVLDEIDMLVDQYGIKELIFQDDEMYANRARAVEIIEGIRRRGYDLIWKNSNLAAWRIDYDLIKLMKESGCYQITISPESGSERVLREIIHKPTNKEASRNIARWCRELGIDLEADFVIGFPGETRAEIQETVDFAEELDADAVKFAAATPFPGTELFRRAVQGGYLPEDFDFYRDDALGFANPVIATEEFSTDDIRRIRAEEWDRINFKTREKTDRYRKINPMTDEELREFRKATREKKGVYFIDQAAGERAASGG